MHIFYKVAQLLFESSHISRHNNNYLAVEVFGLPHKVFTAKWYHVSRS